jgi:hypothetical protein
MTLLAPNRRLAQPQPRKRLWANRLTRRGLRRAGDAYLAVRGVICGGSSCQRIQAYGAARLGLCMPRRRRQFAAKPCVPEGGPRRERRRVGGCATTCWPSHDSTVTGTAASPASLPVRQSALRTHSNSSPSPHLRCHSVFLRASSTQLHVGCSAIIPAASAEQGFTPDLWGAGQ